MDFKIDKGRGTIGARGEGQPLITTRTATEDPKAGLTRKRDSESKSELAAYGQEPASDGESLVVGNIKSILSRQNEVLDEMLSLQTKQLQMARVAEAQPFTTAFHEDLQAEGTVVNDRVQELQTLNNGAYLQGGAYTVSESKGEVRDAIVTGAISPKQRSKYLVANSSDAAEAVSHFEDTQIPIRLAERTQYRAALAKADDLIPETTKEIFTVKETRPNTLESVEEAQRLATNIANKLGAAYGDEQTVSKLIESSTQGLDLERVKGLLS